MKALAALALALCGCAGSSGTVQVSLVTSPGSNLLATVHTLRLILTEPYQEVQARRSTNGFDLALEIDASNTTAAVIVYGFDVSGELVACGKSPKFPLAGISARIAIFMAEPDSVAVAPVALADARDDIAAAPLPYGAVIAGGRDASGAPATAIAVYNAFVHELDDGVALPAPRSGMAMATGSSGSVYLFGGSGADGNPTGTLWRFDTTVAPRGAFPSITDHAGFARTGQRLVPLGGEHFLITGSPPLELQAGELSARSDIAELPETGAAAAGAAAAQTAVFSGASLVRFRGGGFDTLAGTGRTHAVATTLPDGRIAVLGGTPGGRDALLIDAATGAVESFPDSLSQPRQDPVIATTSRYIVVAGGTGDQGWIATADVIDARSLFLQETLPITPRPGGFAIALPSDHVLLGGGVGAPPTLELVVPFFAQ